MTTFIIRDADGNAVNRINADLSFVQDTYEFFEEYVPNVPVRTEEEQASDNAAFEISWRNSELTRTDTLALLPDYPNTEALFAYRQALRDWPSTVDFPDTRPELGV